MEQYSKVYVVIMYYTKEFCRLDIITKTCTLCKEVHTHLLYPWVGPHGPARLVRAHFLAQHTTYSSPTQTECCTDCSSPPVGQIRTYSEFSLIRHCFICQTFQSITISQYQYNLKVPMNIQLIRQTS